MDALMTGAGIHAAVHLQFAGRIHGVDIATDGLHLGHHVGHELLAAEARLHRHHQDDVTLADKGQHSAGGGLGLHHHAGLLALGVDKPQGLVDVLLSVRLHMAGDDVAAGVTELLDVPHGTVDHQVDVQGQAGGGADGLHHGDSDGDIGDEQAVHHVHMDVIGGGDAFDITLEVGEIRRQDRGCDLDHGGAPFTAPVPAARHMIQ